MYLKKVELCGFKSFPEKIDVEFRPGITGVVGPNGCGKTNLADAIRWVLGEQSARQLRGRTMEDVIFNGSESRKPLGMAEVSLTIGGTANLISVPYEEVCITRRVFRSGESEYFLNRKSCRLKDIRDLFLDTGVGSNTYSMIERDMIDEVLDERSGARRAFIEEAGGISKYKDREESARRKLNLTEQDLVRLNDIILELEKRVRSLEYQMGKARRYKRLTERLHTMEAGRAVQEIRSLQMRAEEVKRELEELRTRREACRAALSEAEAELENSSIRRLEHEKQLAGAQEALTDVEKETEALENESLVLRERLKGTRALLVRAGEEKASFEESLNRIQSEREDVSLARVTLEGKRNARQDERRSLEAEVAELENRLREWRSSLADRRGLALRVFENRVRRSNELGTLKKNLERLFEERTAIVQQVTELSSRMEDMSGDLSSLDEDSRRLDTELRRLESRQIRLEEGQKKHHDRLSKLGTQSVSLKSKLNSLEEKLGLLRRLEENLEGYESGVRTVLSRRRNEVEGIVADLVSARKAEHSVAVEAALATSLQWIVTSDLGKACELVEFLRAECGGVAGFLAIDALEQAETDGIPADLVGRPGVVGKAIDCVDFDQTVRPAVQFLLGRTVVTENLDTALDLSGQSRFSEFSFVTLEGESVSMPGRILGGRRSESDPGVIGRKNEVGRAEEETQEVQALLEEIRRFEEKALHVRERLAQVSQILTVTLGDRRESKAECQRRRSDLEVEIAQVDRSREMLADQLKRLESEMQQIERERSSADGEVSSLEGEEGEASRLAAALEQQVQEREKEYREKSARLSAVSAGITSLSEEEARLRSRSSDLEREAGRAGELIERRAADVSRAQAEIEQCEEALVRMADQVRSAALNVEQKRVARDRLREAGAGFQEAEAQYRQKIRDRRSEVEKSGERIHVLEIETAKLEGSEQSIREQIREKYDCELEAIEVPDDLGEVAAEELEDMRRRIKALGPVNLVALEEYEQEKGRLDFLSEQRSDLQSAIGSLEQAILQIQKTTRKRFKEAFEEVRGKFIETFQSLFEGGEADLRLEDPQDPLRSAIAIVARPKGKMERHVALLSGGERSLTAIAFLVSLYLVKPSAFCILDEIDAALDDANVLKFANLLGDLKSKTQFVMITHNKRSMEVGDCLYGVTMSEPGVSRIVSVDLKTRAA